MARTLSQVRDVVVKIDVQGAATIRRLVPDALLIFLAPPDEEELSRRLVSRKTESSEDLSLRSETAAQGDAAERQLRLRGGQPAGAVGRRRRGDRGHRRQGAPPGPAPAGRAVGLYSRARMRRTPVSGRPNVVLVLTDDQGYGDLGCHGNPIVKSPNLDRFHGDSVRLTDYHVGPTCSPTRAGLLTGHYANSTGVWHTTGGRSLLRKDEYTMANMFADAGYRTGMFGKWHLGDSYPFRPEDRGFQEVVRHGGGGVGNTPDYWGNDYFDDTYCANGVWTHYPDTARTSGSTSASTSSRGTGTSRSSATSPPTPRTCPILWTRSTRSHTCRR